MQITASDLILLGHAACGVLGSIAALWVFVEALNATPDSAPRMRAAGLIGKISCLLALSDGAIRAASGQLLAT